MATAAVGVAAGAAAAGGELEREREGEGETWPTSPRVPRALTCAGAPLAACQAAGRRPRPLESIARSANFKSLTPRCDTLHGTAP